MRMPELLKDAPLKGEDVARMVTFSGFWGAIYYLLTCVSLVVTSRRQPVRISGPTASLGMLLHVAAFVVGGSLTSAAGAVIKGKRSTEQAEQSIRSGELERTVPLQALGGALGSVVPFGLAVGSLKLAERVTGQPAIADSQAIQWPQAIGTMALASGATALAVGRIAAWVARDAKGHGAAR